MCEGLNITQVKTTEERYNMLECSTLSRIILFVTIVTDQIAVINLLSSGNQKSFSDFIELFIVSMMR